MIFILDSDHMSTATKGTIGVGVNVIAGITAAQENIEFWMRILSLAVGIMVGILTMISIIRRSRMVAAEIKHAVEIEDEIERK